MPRQATSWERGHPGRPVSVTPGGQDGRAPTRWAGKSTVFGLVGVILFALLANAVPRVAMAQDNGAIVGHVVNGTDGGAVPADLEVVVHVLQNRVKTGERRVRTDGSGAFRVDDLASGPNLLYFPIVEYGGVPYSPDQPVVVSSAEPAPVDLTVF